MALECVCADAHWTQLSDTSTDSEIRTAMRTWLDARRKHIPTLPAKIFIRDADCAEKLTPSTLSQLLQGDSALSLIKRTALSRRYNTLRKMGCRSLADKFNKKVLESAIRESAEAHSKRKRPMFSPPSVQPIEDHYHPEPVRHTDKTRVKFTEQQLVILNRYYDIHCGNPPPETIDIVVAQLSTTSTCTITRQTVSKWFQNQRHIRKKRGQ